MHSLSRSEAIKTPHLGRLACCSCMPGWSPWAINSPRFLQRPGRQYSQHVTYPKAAQGMSSAPREAHLHMVTCWQHFKVPPVFCMLLHHQQ